MAWSSKTQIATSLSAAGTEVYSNAVTMNPGATAVVQVDGNTNGTTDDLLVRVYSTLDASTETWDNTPVFRYAMSKNLDPHYCSFVVTGLYKFRVGFVRSGSTDTWTVNAYYREDGVSL